MTVSSLVRSPAAPMTVSSLVCSARRLRWFSNYSSFANGWDSFMVDDKSNQTKNELNPLEIDFRSMEDLNRRIHQNVERPLKQISDNNDALRICGSSPPLLQHGQQPNLLGYSFTTCTFRAAYGNALVDHNLLRTFHSSPSVLARQRNDGSLGLRTPKREKFYKKENRNQPPVEAPYVPPKAKNVAKSSIAKKIDIFDGMTIAELAKRTGNGG